MDLVLLNQSQVTPKLEPHSRRTLTGGLLTTTDLTCIHFLYTAGLQAQDSNPPYSGHKSVIIIRCRLSGGPWSPSCPRENFVGRQKNVEYFEDDTGESSSQVFMDKSLLLVFEGSFPSANEDHRKEGLIHVKYVKGQSFPIGMVWKFRLAGTSSYVVLFT
ncbi:hypothetical protein TNCV_1284091 [Trichonephila clavipes]|uniref:Uncharacterized protein n=1 Tax=Trichonephila clavipes TaxID=2585209 RepID=A0A8X6SL81_TRICX|nr:hypothetical protein TNCV_1284091 [Trichonephila clavipes]